MVSDSKTTSNMGNRNRNTSELLFSIQKPKLIYSETKKAYLNTSFQLEMKLYSIDPNFVFVYMKLLNNATENQESCLILLTYFLDYMIKGELIEHSLNKDFILVYNNIKWQSFFDANLTICNGRIKFNTDIRFFIL